MNNSDQTNQICRLCGTDKTTPFHWDKFRNYYQCLGCELVFVPESQFMSPCDEKARYDLHQNSPDDPGYRRFLNRFVQPMNALLGPNSSGLDFGCGPGPTLYLLFEALGHQVTNYDPFYAADKSVFDSTYDFICLTEVIEHLHQPAQELERLWRCLKPLGVMGIMTKRVIDIDSFANWHYKNDKTHVSFFHEDTFWWLANHWKAELSITGKDMVIIRRLH